MQAARHRCDCVHGYEGAACEIEINYCEPVNPCLEDGICLRKVRSRHIDQSNQCLSLSSAS